MLTKTEDGDVYRYQLSIELSLELNPLRIFANSEIPPNVDLKRKYDLRTAQVWRSGDRSIFEIDQPEHASVLFYSGSKLSDVNSFARVAGHTKNVLAVVLIRQPTSGISTLPLFVVKWQDVQAYISQPSGAKVSIQAVSGPAKRAMVDRRKAPPVPPPEHPLLPLPRTEDDDLKRQSNPFPNDASDRSQPSSAGSPLADIAANEHEGGIYPYDGSQSWSSSPMMDPLSPTYGQSSSIGVEVPLGSHPLDEGMPSPAAMASNSPRVNGAGISPDGNSVWRRENNVDRLFGEELDKNHGSSAPVVSASFGNVVVEINAQTGRTRSAQGNTPRNSMDDEENATNNAGSRNFFVRELCSAANFVAGAVLGPDSWDKVLNDADGWKRKENSKRYIEAMDRFDKACNGEGRDKVQEIARKVRQYLLRSEPAILQLAFAAKVFYKSGMYEIATDVLVHLNVKFGNEDSGTFENALQRSSGDFVRADRKPNNIFQYFFMRVVKSWNYLGPFPVGLEAILLCMFNFWVKCGMLQRTSIDWNELRSVVSSSGGFSPCENKALQRSVGSDRANTLGLLLCHNVEQAVRLLATTKKTTLHVRYISVEPIFATWLITHINDTIASTGACVDAIGRVWRDILVALDYTSFRQPYNENFRRDVLSKLVDCSSFRERKSFQYYLSVFEAVNSNYAFHDCLMGLVRESIFLDLRSKTQPPPMHEFLSMLNSRTGEVLSTAWNGDKLILDFVKSTVARQASFEDQVVFIDRFFDILFSRTSILKYPAQLVRPLITFVLEINASKPRLWMMAFHAAKAMPLLFQRCGDEQVRSIVELFIPTDQGVLLLEQPQLVVDVFRIGEDHVPGPFFSNLQARAETILRKTASSMHKACAFYIACHHGASGRASMAIAECIFLDAFAEWNPSSLTTIVDKDESTLALMFRCFNDCPPPSIADCATKVMGVVVEWHRAFQDNGVTLGILQDSLQACKKAGWQPLCEWAGIQIQSESTVAGKLDELENAAAEVFELLSVRDAESTPIPLSVLLKGYNCHPVVGSDFERLLSRYEPYLLPQCPTDAVTFLDKTRLELREIQSDRDAASKFIKEYGDVINLCDYFSKTPSALFRNGMSTFSKNKLDVETLRDALERTLETIAELFSPKTTFKDVDTAVKLISTSNGELEQELESLAGCAGLSLTAEHQERFKAVALMSRFSGLSRFIKFCHQYKFSVVQSDSDFKRLEAVAISLVSEEVVGLDAAECMDFSAMLARLLCPGIVEQSSIVELRSQMEDKLPCINTLGLLSTYSEIWTFAREMNWFGREGLKKFHAEYNNCTNVLLGNTASYEMSVLYALQPTILAVSLIGSLQDEKSLGAFLDALQASADVKKCSQGGTSSDLNQVQSNLSQIREWFTNGVDDIASVHGLFEAVIRTGEYSIQVNQDKEPNLTLAYQDKDGKKLLQGKDLVGFVQHVGLIQHDDERIADEVLSFIELNMMLSKAANNIVEMLNLGFDADIESFICGAGSGHLDEARELLRSSDVASRAHETQLQALRENYRVSTLFFTEELKEIYDILTFGGADSERWPELVRKISCLLDPSLPRLSWEERCHACENVALAMKHVRNCNSFGWLRIASRLVENLHSAFGDRAIQCDAKDGQTGRIVLHTLSVEDDQVNWAMFCLLRSIYKDRLPESFEVLDVMAGCTLDHLEIFLRRAQMFTSCTFVLLNVDRLIGKLPETLASFLSRRDIASCGVHLHCVQSKASLLHTGPWVDGATWDSASLQVELGKHGVRDDAWKRLVLDRRCVDYVRIFWTPASGTGKTCYIRKKLSELQHAGSEVATITIHEASSISSLVGDLLKNFSSAEENMAVHFNFCYLPGREEAAYPWLESVNQFFFSLLILRSVRDPMSGQSFHLGVRSWKIFIELPAEATNAYDWLHANIPTLEFCGTNGALKNEYHIDKETRRVCTYLRAFRDGTINRKFVATRRQIFFVLDRSGSMNVSIGSSTALSVATDNALRLFDSHVSVGDLFGLTMFDSFTSVVILLQEVADAAMKARLGLN